MADEQENENQLKQRVDEFLVDARNEAIVQTASLYILARQALLAGIGLSMFGMEAVQTLLERAVERGEIAELDAQEMLQRMREEGLAQNSLAGSAASLTDRASVALADSTASILRILHVRS